MTSALTAARQGLEDALLAQGLRVMEPSGQASPPCVFVVPGDPWLTPSTMGQKQRRVSFRLIGLVGTASPDASQADAEAMAQALADAVYATTSPPWTLLTIAPTATVEVGQVVYLAVIGQTETNIAGGSAP
jgi:hypothetical protein